MPDDPAAKHLIEQKKKFRKGEKPSKEQPSRKMRNDENSKKPQSQGKLKTLKANK